MKVLYTFGANFIFVVHVLLVLLVVFGWMLPSLWGIYMGALVATLLSDIVFGYCILSKWEFDFRKKLDPTTNYNYTWTTFYTYKITNKRISDRFYKRAAIIALTVVICLNIYFKFLY